MAEANGSAQSGVERAASVLMLFTRTRRPSLGVTEIATELGQSKAVVHRVLSSLRAAELVEADPVSRRYRLGTAALALGRAYLEGVEVRTLARPALEHLSRATDETATLSVRHGDHRIYVDQVVSDQDVKMSVSIGRPYPLHAGASSKAFLAFLDDAEREQYLASHDLERLTDQTLVSVEALRTDLAAIRKRGFARSREERQSGAASVAAPVFDVVGHPVGVISICGPAHRFRGVDERASSELLVTTRELSARLGFH